MEDPNPLVRGRGFAYLREHGVDVEVGLGGDVARHLNDAFFTRVTAQRPFVTAKVALSLDGYLAATPGQPTALTSAAMSAALGC